VPRRPARSRRIATALRWPVGIGLTSWRYLWRITALHRQELPGSPRDGAPPPIPPGVDRRELQPAEDGVGPLFHRRYRARMRQASVAPDVLVERVAGDLNRVAPTEFARFDKVLGDGGAMRAGDEYVVRMPGPWDGPVRVVEVAPASFRLATLAGHLEAGQIEFSAARDGEDVVFTIESWARSGDRLSSLLYERLRMAKEVQLHMWTSFLERVAVLSGGRLAGGVEIRTWRVGGPIALNFDPAALDRLDPRDRWHVDDHRRRLPPEPPGPPVPGGSWEVACRLIRDYELADPGIVRALSRPGDPLDGRDMVLELRFLGLRFRVGVRVENVHDERRTEDGRPVRAWGWSYSTLAGHLEQGRLDYEVVKWIDTGEVEFRIHAVSRPAHVPNPLIRLGFRLVGRRRQLAFYRRAGDRVARLTRLARDDRDAARREADAARRDRRLGER
jgi:uncharacterized protein (UPF0548 family)